jgi:sugar phosphate permease
VGIGVWSSCENLGGALANSIAAGVLSQTGSWRSVFFVSGPVIVIWAAAMFFVIPADSATKPPSKASTAPLSVPGVGAAAFTQTLTKAARCCLMFWLPFFLQDYVKMGPVQSGMIAAVLDVGGTLGAILTGAATDGLYGGCALRAAMHLCAATGACFIGWAAACAAGATATPHVIGIGLVGFFITGPGGVLGASARGLVGYAGLDSDKPLVASVANLVNGLASLGAVAGSLLAPQLVAFLGWPGLFATLGVAMLAAAATLIPAVAIEAATLEKRKEREV